MIMIKMSVCLLLCLLLPFFWGSVWQYIARGGKQGKSESAVLTGWICFLTGFEVLAVLSAVRGWELSRLVRLTALLAGGLTVIAALFCLRRGYRSFVADRCRQMTAGQQLLMAAFAAAFLCIAGVYVLGGFRQEVYQSLPEEVTAILGAGRLCQVNPLTGQSYGPLPLSEKLYQLPALYAVLAGGLGLRTEELLFEILPYICLVGMLLAALEVSAVFFEKSGRRAIMLLAFAAVILCGSGAYMNVPYEILYAPYEGTALLGGLLLLHLFVLLHRTWESRRACRWMGALQIVLCLAASLLTAGAARGLLPACMEVVIFVCGGVIVTGMQRVQPKTAKR